MYQPLTYIPQQSRPRLQTDPAPVVKPSYVWMLLDKLEEYDTVAFWRWLALMGMIVAVRLI